jgi:hypothetical protein
VGKLIRGIKTRRDFISGNTDFSFESEEVTGSLFNEEEVERLIMLIKFKKIHCFSYQIRNGYCGSAAGTSKSVV